MFAEPITNSVWKATGFLPLKPTKSLFAGEGPAWKCPVRNVTIFFIDAWLELALITVNFPVHFTVIHHKHEAVSARKYNVARSYLHLICWVILYYKWDTLTV